MEDVEVAIGRSISPQRTEAEIERALTVSGLQISLKCSLAKFAGCVHWHLRLKAQPGTLELTYWPKEQRVWFSIHRGRGAPWMKEVIATVRQQIEMSPVGDQAKA